MDRRTQIKLAAIGAAIPKELLRKGIRREKPFDFNREAVLDIIRDKRTPIELRRELERALRDEKVYTTHMRESTSVDEKVGAQISEIVDAKVRSETKRGRIPPADAKEYQRFLKRVHKK